MTGSNTRRELNKKGRIIDSGGAVFFQSIPDMWQEMQRRNYNKYYNYICRFDIYKRIKNNIFLDDIYKPGA
jgi:hypothetical protein